MLDLLKVFFTLLRSSLKLTEIPNGSWDTILVLQTNKKKTQPTPPNKTNQTKKQPQLSYQRIQVIH